MFESFINKLRLGREGIKIFMKILDELETEIKKLNLKERILFPSLENKNFIKLILIYLTSSNSTTANISKYFDCDNGL